ncbi:MAG: EamA family transporter [Candidatus Xenobia bacterium]
MAQAAVWIIWGSTYLAIRYALEGWPPFLMAGVRFVLAGGLLYAGQRRRVPAPAASVWLAAALCGALFIVGGNGLTTLAEETVPSGITAMLIATTPLWMVLLEWGWHARRPRMAEAAGLLLGFAGAMLLANPGAWPGLGAILSLLAALSWAIGSVYTRLAPLPVSVLMGTGMEMLVGGVLLLMMAAVRGEASPVLTMRSSLALLYLVGPGSIVAYTAYVWLLQNVSAAQAASCAYVNPVIAVILGWAVGGEALGPRALTAAAGIVVAVVMITVAPGRGVGMRSADGGSQDGVAEGQASSQVPMPSSRARS